MRSEGHSRPFKEQCPNLSTQGFPQAALQLTGGELLAEWPRSPDPHWQRGPAEPLPQQHALESKKQVKFGQVLDEHQNHFLPESRLKANKGGRGLPAWFSYQMSLCRSCTACMQVLYQLDLPRREHEERGLSDQEVATLGIEQLQSAELHSP